LAFRACSPRAGRAGQFLPALSLAKSKDTAAKRFEKHGESYFTFITTPGVGPTNNLAEQAIRFVVIDRHITQGTRSESGQRWNERIWTVIATCVQQEKSVHDYLQEAVDAWFRNGPAPSLLPKVLKE
jgi:transposase